jgi:hypothetical protein
VRCPSFLIGGFFVAFFLAEQLCHTLKTEFLKLPAVIGA